MTSNVKEAADGFDLHRDIPLTDADIAALDRARVIQPLDWGQYLEWLSHVTAAGQRRQLPLSMDAPFEL
jgi:hypothetical protein